MTDDKLTFNNLGQFAQGGIASLDRIVLQDGTHAIYRYLQAAHTFNFKQQASFRRGVKIRALLSPHPNIASSMETGLKCLKPYEIIEFVDGKNLKVHMNNRDPRLQNDLYYLLTETAEALAWIHQNGFMHLDVKPENYLVHFSETHPVIKLTDFDLAQKATWNSPHKQMGTKAYMAPEQFNDHTAFQASDVFAFSVMAYQLITGKDPFPADTQKQSLKRQASLTFVPKAPLELVPDLNPKLSNLVMTGLEKHRERRFPNMQTLVATLKKIHSIKA